MRLTQSTRVSILAVLMAGTAWAQTPAADTPAPAADAPAAVAAPAAAAAAPAEDPAHNELRKLRADMEDALNKGDLDGLLAHVDDTIVFTAMNAQTGHGKQGIRDYFNKMMTGDKRIVQSVKMDFVPDGLSVFYGPDVAVSSGSACTSATGTFTSTAARSASALFSTHATSPFTSRTFVHCSSFTSTSNGYPRVAMNRRSARFDGAS